jgi:hypothetical protein
MSKVVIVSMPELQEGLEGYPVCVVNTEDVQKVEKILTGKGLGVQGTEDGVKWWTATEEEAGRWNHPYALLQLELDAFATAIEKGTLDWHSVIGWQRWGSGYVLPERRTIRIKGSAREDISPLWETLGYVIEEISD